MSLLRSRARRVAPHLYTAIVEAARASAFYRDFAVADTIEGRYEMIVLHIALLLRRLREAGAEQSRLAQAVVDFMAADLDRSMRELGVGDLSVSRTMKRLGEGLYGRAAAYDAALDAGDWGSLSKALEKNIYGGVSPGDAILAAMTKYVENQARHLAAQSDDDIAAGSLNLLVPMDIPHD
jgi:cytochrome b pre-mRNA-processing protein 3